MPRVIRHTLERHPRHQELLAVLVKEFSEEGPGPQPLILEVRAPHDRTRTVYVIWDELKDLSLEQRYDLILDAYRQAEGERAVGEIISATGLTGAEAVGYGLLPYRVAPERLLPTKRRGDKWTIKDVTAAMTEEAAHTIPGPTAPHLRYVSKEDAEAARQRLKAKLPGVRWEILEDDEEVED